MRGRMNNAASPPFISTTRDTPDHSMLPLEPRKPNDPQRVPLGPSILTLDSLQTQNEPINKKPPPVPPWRYGGRSVTFLFDVRGGRARRIDHGPETRDLERSLIRERRVWTSLDPSTGPPGLINSSRRGRGSRHGIRGGSRGGSHGGGGSGSRGRSHGGGGSGSRGGSHGRSRSGSRGHSSGGSPC